MNSTKTNKAPFPKALYVHIPFCQSICPYCDFPKVFYRSDWANPYLDALFSEVAEREVGIVDTIYVGGGTPTSLSIDELHRLLEGLSPHLAPGGEFSFEANPESFTEEKAKLLASFGVNRISFGVQSFQRKMLETLGRKHAKADVIRAVGFAKKTGIPRINLDMMFALPGQTMEDLEKDIEEFLSLRVGHLSAYSLIVNPGCSYYVRKIPERSEDDQAEMYQKVLSSFRKAGYSRYEFSNFALPGEECRHNLTYWKDEEYYGVGLGAAGFVGGYRYSNTLSLSLYIKNKGKQKSSNTELTADDLLSFLMCNLRLEKGFSFSRFANRFGQSLFELCPQTSSLLKKGLLVIEGENIHASDRGLMILDSIVLDLVRDN